MIQEKYYVYEWFIKDTGEIFYVGKGCGKRYKVLHGRSNIFMSVFSDNDCDVRIIKYFSDEKDAFDYEAKRIEELKKVGQCRCNLHSGGAGGSGEYWTDELRYEYSVNNVMKSQEQRERMRTNNPMQNAEIAEKTNAQKRIPIIINNIEYESIASANEATGYSKDTISNWCEYGNCPDGVQCSYKDVSHKSKGSKKFIPFTYKDKHYDKFDDFYKETGIKRTTLKNWLYKGFDNDGNICRRDNDNRNLIYSPNKSMRAVIVNGVHYKSISMAEKANNLQKGYISRILNNEKYGPNYICVYDDQQPSQGNTDNSTLEGSTTNE